MPTEPTLLVLGAGASVPYGFPTGRMLVQEICQGINDGDSSEILQQLMDCGENRKVILDFAEALRNSSQPSVDAFLEKRPEFMTIGKLAIALVLIRHEDPAMLRPQLNGKGRWYEYLFGRLSDGVPDPQCFQYNRLSVITFNYDFSFEQFMFTSLRNAYKLDDSGAKGLLCSIPISHFYGNLGELDQLLTQGRRPENLRAAAERIRIVSQQDELPPLFRCLTDPVLEKAVRICFLGFGYHAENLRRLGVAEFIAGKKIYGSAHGMTDQELSGARDILKGQLVVPTAHCGKDILDTRRELPVLT